MSSTRTYGAFRTGRLWGAAAGLFGVLFVASAWALLVSLEFDEQCAQGGVEGPGALGDIRRQAFPPAVICEYAGGEVSSGGTGLLGGVIWLCAVGLALCVLLALLAECAELPDSASPALRFTRAQKLRRTGTALLVTGSVFLLAYGPTVRPLLTAPSSACAVGGGWGVNAPQTLDASLFPAQATCQFRSGGTEKLNPPWTETLTPVLAVPTVIAATAAVLAWRRRRAEREQDEGEEARRADGTGRAEAANATEAADGPQARRTAGEPPRS
ncbi:hypothetical protein [Streptomyces iconiensis]|uniref:Integral membrane protein n=1 Tax=Streptomyces iconiensis TaxID=1384038 RepID=A0ABT7A2E4_9ACTN|nr:hypothetical protein [Streptomyces iconiensis]MDJ1135513.1 hypothetical protein [Streptomyces iconiensis]